MQQNQTCQVRSLGHVFGQRRRSTPLRLERCLRSPPIANASDRDAECRPVRRALSYYRMLRS